MATKADFIIISEPDHINLVCPHCDESFDIDWSELYEEYGEDLWMADMELWNVQTVMKKLSLMIMSTINSAIVSDK